MPGMNRVLSLYKDIQAIESAMSLMAWDQQVLMPAQGIRARSQHMVQLSTARHEILTSDELNEAIETAKSQVDEFDIAALRVVEREVEEAQKLPRELIQRKAEVSAQAYRQWRVSKESNDFASMVPFYQEVFDIAAETSNALSDTGHPYDALINMYEEGSTFAEANEVLGKIKDPSISLLAAIRDSKVEIDDSFLIRDWNHAGIRMTMERIVTQIGFSLDRGRLDISNNAFCANFGNGDVRMTTRPSEHIKGLVSSTLHEMGHALYEQNQRDDWQGTPLSGGVSLAIHESQSRTWENVIGRSESFWNYFWPWFQEQHPFLAQITNHDFYRAYNKVKPDFIRVGADEISYNLHILIRFELEVEMVTGAIKAGDLAEAWNAKYQQYLGIKPPTDTLGVLQDVHWSKGSVGYFPTYSFGNLIGVQIWNRMCQEIDNYHELLETGNFRPILDWLTEKVYGYGRLMPPKDLLEHVTGEQMSEKPWLDYATKKFSAIYNL